MFIFKISAVVMTQLHPGSYKQSTDIHHTHTKLSFSLHFSVDKCIINFFVSLFDRC